MSSASERASRRLLGLALVVSATAAACDERRTYSSGESVALGAPPRTERPVGPTPGPQVDAGPAPTNPFADQDPIILNEGRLYFARFNCSGCHGDHGGGGMGPSLRDVDWLYGNGDGDIFASIADGRGHGMPAWGQKVPDAIIWKLVAYIKSLRKPYEPSPPDQTTPPPPLADK